MTQPLHTILIVAENALLRLDVANILAELSGVQIVAVGSPSKARAVLETQAISCVIIDFDIGEEDALTLACGLAARAIPALIISSFGPSLEFPAHLPLPPVLEKPFAADVLKRMTKELLALSGRGPS